MRSPEISTCLYHLCPREGRITHGAGLSEHTFTFSFGQKSACSPRFLMKSRTALITAITTCVMLTFTAGFLVKKWGKSILSAFFGTINEGLPLKGRMKRKRKHQDYVPKSKTPVSLGRKRCQPWEWVYLINTSLGRESQAGSGITGLRHRREKRTSWK